MLAIVAIKEIIVLGWLIIKKIKVEQQLKLSGITHALLSKDNGFESLQMPDFFPLFFLFFSFISRVSLIRSLKKEHLP